MRAKARNERIAREENGDGGDAQNQNAPSRRERAPRGENRRNERPRHEESAQTEAPAGLASTEDTQLGGEVGADNQGERRERRSRDRYGRDRRERGGEQRADRPSELASQEPLPSTSMPKVQPFILSLPELQAIAQNSGLEWVNSDAARIAAVQAAIAAEPKPVHVPRERPAPVVVDEGPLVLVETRKELV
jgi:ribonuclease E